MKVLLLLAALLIPAPAPTAQLSEPAAREVLASWDAERSAAWAAGDVRGLEALYTDDSIAGQRDVAMLQRWLDRDLVVTDLRMQVLSLALIAGSDHRLVLAVVDRVANAEVAGKPLPIDAPTARRLVLRQVDGAWLVASVAPDDG